MNKRYIIDTILIIAFLAFVISVTSCGARKSKTTKIETEIKKDLVVDIKNNVTKTTKVETTEDVVTETTTYTPIDNTKPSKVEDKEFLNTSIVKQKKTLKTAKKEDAKIVDLTTEKATVKNSLQVQEKEKEVDKKQFNYFQLLWLLIPLGIGIFLLKKYTKILTF